MRPHVITSLNYLNPQNTIQTQQSGRKEKKRALLKQIQQTNGKKAKGRKRRGKFAEIKDKREDEKEKPSTND